MIPKNMMLDQREVKLVLEWARANCVADLDAYDAGHMVYKDLTREQCKIKWDSVLQKLHKQLEALQEKFNGR